MTIHLDFDIVFLIFDESMFFDYFSSFESIAQAYYGNEGSPRLKPNAYVQPGLNCSV